MYFFFSGEIPDGNKKGSTTKEKKMRLNTIIWREGIFKKKILIGCRVEVRHAGRPSYYGSTKLHFGQAGASRGEKKTWTESRLCEGDEYCRRCVSLSTKQEK